MLHDNLLSVPVPLNCSSPRPQHRGGEFCSSLPIVVVVVVGMACRDFLLSVELFYLSFARYCVCKIVFFSLFVFISLLNMCVFVYVLFFCAAQIHKCLFFFILFINLIYVKLYKVIYTKDKQTQNIKKKKTKKKHPTNIDSVLIDHNSVTKQKWLNLNKINNSYVTLFM